VGESQRASLSVGEIKKMAFTDSHTTLNLVTLDKTPDKVESKKVVLSEDAFAICQLLETLVNTSRKS
jgi:hypothetical protein